MYTTTYGYDLNSRRVTVAVPATLAPSGSQNTLHYSYDPATGMLAGVSDVLGNSFSYAYNDRGDLTTTGLNDVLNDVKSYDDDGDLVEHDVNGSAGSFRQAHFVYDGRGKQLSSRDMTTFRDSLAATYSGLGHLLSSAYGAWGPSYCGGTVANIFMQTMTYDAFGNRLAASGTNGAGSCGYSDGSGATPGTATYEHGTGRLLEMDDAQSQLTSTYSYDAAGNTEFWSQAKYGGSGAQDRATFYAADGSVYAADTRWVADWLPPGTGLYHVVDGMTSTFEEYRYDALGRRVWVRSRRSCTNMVASSDCQMSSLRRLIWDGSSLLAEVQMPGGDDDSAVWENDSAAVHEHGTADASNRTYIDPNPFYGRVLYTQGVATDEPLDVVRLQYADSAFITGNTYAPYTVYAPFAILPLWNARGQPDQRVFATGSRTHCVPSPHCATVVFPAGWFPYNRVTYVPVAWHGSLLEDQADKSGTLYRRNRLYDPLTGRFTQEDPIGLAGGVNAYGFANSDPVSYSDPFGLCPKDAGGDGKTEGFADCAKGTSGYYANEDANGRGGIINTAKGLIASCKESAACAATAVVGGVVTGEIVASEIGAALLGETAGAAGEITGATKHGINRVIQRGVKPGDILNAVRNGEGIRAVDKLGRTSYRYVGEKATVILNEAGKIISAWNGGW